MDTNVIEGETCEDFTCMLCERHEDVRCMALLWPLWTDLEIVSSSQQNYHVCSLFVPTLESNARFKSFRT